MLLLLLIHSRQDQHKVRLNYWLGGNGFMDISSWWFRHTFNRESQMCMKIEFKLEYPWKLFLLGHWYWKHKFFHSNPLFSSSPGFLAILHLPSGDENFFVDYPPLSYIKSCVLACRLQKWTSFLVLPKQNME